MKFKITIPFVEALGFELLRFEDGQAEIGLTPREEHMNSWSVLHGGVSMTLLDVAMAHAARSVRLGDASAAGIATIEMKTQFMRPAEGRLVAVGKLLHGGGRMAFCEGSVHDGAGGLCAHATGTFKYTSALRRSGDVPTK